MIVADNVTKSYPLLNGFKRYYVFRGLSLKLPARTNIGVIGRNGAGKTTLIRLLAGLELPDSGSVTCDGRISPPLALRTGFSGSLSGRENTRFICRICGDTPDEARERIESIRAYAEIGEFFEYPVNTYSTGMKARLGFAVSMAYSYDYYLIDEATAVGDEKFKIKSQKSFEEKRGKASIVIVSHGLAHLKEWCQAGIYLKEGQALYFDDIDEAISMYKKDQAA